MAGYDPKRNRPPAVESDETEPAPVEALLTPGPDPGPEPDPVPGAADEAATGAEPEVVSAPSVTPPVLAAPAPEPPLARVAVVAGVAAAVVALVVWWRSSRKG